MDLAAREKLIYELSADGACEFENGQTIKISKAMLANHSKFFMDAFFGPSSRASVKITNFDCDTFKTFLDCLFGIKEYTILDSLVIYPIAHQYDVKESLQRCTAVLEPTKMSENICLTLNLALFYKSDELVAKLIHLIKTKIGIIDFMENQKYRSLLDPIAVAKLIENIELHSFVLDLIYKWGKDYLKKHNKTVNINLFLEENGILSSSHMPNFESVQSMFRFLETSGWEIIDHGDALLHLRNKLLKSDEEFPKRSEWVKLPLEEFEETIEFANSLITTSDVSIQIFANVVFTGGALQNFYFIKANVDYCFREIFYSAFHRKLLTTQSSWSPKYIVEILDKPAAVITITLPKDKFLDVKSVRISYDFTGLPSNCRILKTSLNDKFFDADKLYFTKNVICKPKFDPAPHC